jgi:hypothetical protein
VTDRTAYNGRGRYAWIEFVLLAAVTQVPFRVSNAEVTWFNR